MANIVIRNLTKKYGSTTVIENLNITLEDGQFTVLVGPSGCGKTTLLRMIAGIEKVTEGKIFIDGQEITTMPAGQRGIAMVFQNYALYPTMTVRENIEFGLKNIKVPKNERKSLISEVSEIVGLSDFLERKPAQLSGGQRQRVALARAMVKKPKIFLMDEPLSNLDAKLRAQMRVELKELHRRLGSTFVYVTHDQIEAMSMADDIILMENGQVRQEASPEGMYKDPQHIFTAKFIGTPPMNIVLTDQDGLYLGCRPEHIKLSNEKTQDFISTRCRVITREMLGCETHYQVETAIGKFMVKLNTTETGNLNTDDLFMNVAEKDLFMFAKEGYRIEPYFNNYGEYLRKIESYVHTNLE